MSLEDAEDFKTAAGTPEGCLSDAITLFVVLVFPFVLLAVFRGCAIP